MAEQNTRTTFPETILDFAFFPYKSPIVSGWPDAIAKLAGLAETEDWTGPHKTKAPNQILINYISVTYKRLVIEEKISICDDGNYATFNTGLLTPHGEEIFGHFTKNRNVDKQPWWFLSWVAESDRILMNNFPNLPDMAEYVTVAADLVYDTHQKLTLDYSHIIDENLDRFPQSLANSKNEARKALNNAKDLALKRLRRNYKLAIPQWYPKLGRGGAQLLLPLYLTPSGTADLALVVSANPGSGYRGYTILTLEMAYSNARLVARPDSDWLKPQVGNSN
jgi:hypothetical protein